MSELTAFQRKVSDLLPDILLRFNEPMSKHTSFRIGGPAEVMAFPNSGAQLAQVLRACKEFACSWRVLGAGTNVLAPDDLLPGLTICLKDCLDGVQQIDDTTIRVMAGVTMTRAAVFAANLGLSGMEFAHGIPGTVGGGVYMNAGAYGGEIKDICVGVEVMDPDGNIRTLTNEEMDFSYRHSRLEDEGGIVLSADFRLVPKPVAEIRIQMRELMSRRSASQPLNMPSAGSAFKRPKVGYAAALIDQAGLKGYSVGGAAVSEKHAGFVVNLGSATAEDVRGLLASVAQIVMEKSGVQLEPEVRIW
jgi:UDP-N-acetylmuramate dehydrogenase